MKRFWCVCVLVVVPVVAILGGGCAGGYGENEQLRRQVDQFNDSVRWGRYYSAALFIRDDARADWLHSHREWGRDLRIADYEVVDSNLEPNDSRTAVIRVVVSWYRLSENEIQTTMLAQRWRRQGRTWQLISEEVEEGTPL